MTKNTFFALIFFTSVIFIAGWKYWAWLIWKVLRWRSKEQVFDLLSKHRFIEITGSSGIGKSWLLMHLFKHLQGVKFTNCPTPQNTYTLNKKILETHLIGKWDAPNKWFYFLDDINLWQKWCQKEFGKQGYLSLKDYLTQVGKLGGAFIWTNNGIEPEHVLKIQKNKTWKVLTYITFKNKSLLFVQINDSWHKSVLPTIVPIDNLEIQSFYDPHWNIPRQISQSQLARDINVSLKRVNEICQGKRGITLDTAYRLGLYFNLGEGGTEFWMNLQKDYEKECWEDYLDENGASIKNQVHPLTKDQLIA